MPPPSTLSLPLDTPLLIPPHSPTSSISPCCLPSLPPLTQNHARPPADAQPGDRQTRRARGRKVVFPEILARDPRRRTVCRHANRPRTTTAGRTPWRQVRWGFGKRVSASGTPCHDLALCNKWLDHESVEYSVMNVCTESSGPSRTIHPLRGDPTTLPNQPTRSPSPRPPIPPTHCSPPPLRPSTRP